MIHTAATQNRGERTHAPDLLSYNGVDGRNQRFLQLGAVPTKVGDELDGLGAGPLSDR